MYQPSRWNGKKSSRLNGKKWRKNVNEWQKLARRRKNVNAWQKPVGNRKNVKHGNDRYLHHILLRAVHLAFCRSPSSVFCLAFLP